MLTLDERKAREKALQDERFAADDGSRGGAGGAYAICGASHGYYKQRLAADAPGKRTLEIGSGRGETTIDLARCGAIATGIDLSEVAAQNANALARELGVDATFLAMDAEAMSFKERSFDIISGGAILHHLDVEKAYSEIARALKPSGYALFLEPLGYNPFINLYRRLTPKLRTPDEHPLLLHDLRLAHRYFGKVNVAYYYLTTLLTLPVARTPLGPSLIAAANAADRALFRLFPPLRKYAWYIVLELGAPRQG
jgi:SAM-dependent methyltransferase